MTHSKTMSTPEPFDLNTAADFMRSCKHLSAHATAVVVNRHTMGIDWRASPKGKIASGLLERHGHTITDRLLFDLRCTRAMVSIGNRGSGVMRDDGFGVTEDDRAALHADVADCEERLKAHAPGLPLWRTEERLKNARAALVWLDAQSSDPRTAAMGRLRAHLAGITALLADLDTVTKR